MEKEIYVDGKMFALLYYRSFLYKGQRYAVFIHPEKCDEEGDPILYVLAGSNGHYTLPAKEDEEVLILLMASLLNNEEPFDFVNEDIFWLPWGE